MPASTPSPSSLKARLSRLLRAVGAPTVLVPATLLVLFTGFAGLGVAWGSWQNVCASCPSVAQIRTWEPEQTSKLFTSDGRLISELGMQRRTPESIDSLPAYVPQAVLAIEDRRFYEHNGFDVRGFTRAALGQLMGQYRGGGSTITQQLARNMFSERVGTEQRYTRKLRELQVAFELERSYDKDRILEAYMNEIYMGRGYGFQSASRAYFGKDVSEVDVAEAALLAAILNRPSFYDPFRNPEATLGRRNLVLSRMVDAGYLEADEAEMWKQAPLPVEDHSSSSVHGIAPYFEEWVRQILDSRFGDEVYRGGLRVYTTLDLDVQKAAVEAMNWGWDRIESQPNYRHPLYADFDTVAAFDQQTPYLQGMMIVVEPGTGHVKALIGGRDFEQSKFDRARLARRQAGSSFKPFVYASALASGLPASHIVEDQPVVYPQVSGEDWRPSNFDGQFRGPITIRQGLRLSINMVAIKLGWEEVGIETVAQTARRMGVATEIERFPSTTIGAVEVVPLELAEAYSAFATVGTKVRPFPILRVENAEGELLWEPQPERTQVLDSLPARIMVDLLEDAANRGTGGNIRRRALGNLPYEVPAAGKTGTTNDGTNTWFMGFTPNLMAGVWFGMDRPIPIVRGNPQATGGFYAAPVWGRFMRHVYYGMEDVSDTTATAGRFDEGAVDIPEPWPMPSRLTTREVDGRSGKLWSPWCSAEVSTENLREGSTPVMRRYAEIYIPGTEPTEMCDDTRRQRFRIPRGLSGGRRTGGGG